MDELEVGLFRFTPEGGVSMVGKTRDPAIIETVRAVIVEQRRQELAELEQADDQDQADRSRRGLRPVK